MILFFIPVDIDINKERRKEYMEGNVCMRIKPYKGRYVSRKRSNRINDMLLSTQKPDHTALKKEAEEFIEYIKTVYSEESRE